MYVFRSSVILLFGYFLLPFGRYVFRYFLIREVCVSFLMSFPLSFVHDVGSFVVSLFMYGVMLGISFVIHDFFM